MTHQTPQAPIAWPAETVSRPDAPPPPAASESNPPPRRIYACDGSGGAIAIIFR
jgi:hypothetical protein